MRPDDARALAVAECVAELTKQYGDLWGREDLSICADIRERELEG